MPELAAGADVLLRPLPEADELDLPVFDVDEVEPDELERAAALDVDDELWADAVAACVDPGRVYATAPAASTLVSPATAVTVRILARLRSLAAAWSADCESGDIVCPSVGW